MELDQQLVLRPVREAVQRPPPRLDLLDRDRLERPVAERRQQVRVQRRAVVAERRRLALAVLGDEAQPLLSRLRKGRTARSHARQRPLPCLTQDVLQPRLSGALGEVAGGRAASLRPGRPDLLLDLPTVGQPVLRVPDRTPRTVDPEDVSRWLYQRSHAWNSTTLSGHIRDIFGNPCLHPNPRLAYLLGFSSAGTGTRTRALRIKSPLLYQLSYAGVTLMMAAGRS